MTVNRNRIMKTAGLMLLCIPKLFAKQGEVTALSLKNCVSRTVEMNVNVSQVELARKKSVHKTAETFTNLLPQVEVGGMFQDNIARTQQMNNIVKTLVNNGLGRQVDNKDVFTISSSQTYTT